MMNVLVLCILIALVAFGLAVLVVFEGGAKRHAMLLRFAAAEHERSLETVEAMTAMSRVHDDGMAKLLEVFGFRITEASQRESRDIESVLKAQHGERSQLVTALLATMNSGLPSQRLGLIDAAVARAENPPEDPVAAAIRFRDLVMGEREPAGTDDFDVRVPVGMG